MHKKAAIEKGTSIFAKFISNKTEERRMTLANMYDAVF